MNKKEVSEIKKRFNPDRSNITHLYGCYVNANGEIIARIDESVGLLMKEEAEKYLGILKKAMSGSLGRNLQNLSFATKAVVDGEEHKLLMALRKSELKDEELCEQLYKKIIGAVDMDGENYVILIATDKYDVPHRGKDGNFHDDESSDTFQYLICAICPVKSGKAALGYDADESRFHNRGTGQLIAAPELGFLFPAFDERATNIYGALLYSRGVQNSHKEFVDAVFGTEVPMAAGVQKETFRGVLAESLEKDCSFEVIKGMHDRLNDRIEIHKESKDPEPLTLSVEEVSEILEQSGASEEHIERFEKQCEHEFGENAELHPANIIAANKLDIRTPEVKISVPAQYSGLIQTRVIDGKKYILIPADAGVEINELAVRVGEKEPVTE